MTGNQKPKIVKMLSSKKSGDQGKVLVLNHLLSNLVSQGNSWQVKKYLLNISVCLFSGL